MYRALRTAPRLLRLSHSMSLRPMSSAQSIDKKVQEVQNPIDAKTKADMECPETNQENSEQAIEHGVNSKFAALAEKIQKDSLKEELKSYCTQKAAQAKADSKAVQAKADSKSNRNKQAKA